MPRKGLKHHKRNKLSRAMRLFRARQKEIQNSSAVVTVPDTEETSEDIFNKLLEESRQQDNQRATVSERCDMSDESEKSSVEDDLSDYELPPLITEPISTQVDNLSIKGRRIVDMEHILKQLRQIALHPNHCTMGNYKYMRENKIGLFCEWVYYCDNCEKEFTLTSEPIDRKQEINDAVVWGALSVGIGYNQVEELFSVLDVPTMGRNKFQKHEQKIGQIWEESLVQKMKENAKEERRIAIARGNFQNGVPFITVIGDGGWAKRSYGHGMNSLSGVGAIIGAHTKKILFLGVRNKFCFACSNPNKKNEDHVCFKNYVGSSTGMESNVIVEGFRRSEEDYGLIYKHYIGDGDSSVFARIQEGCRYGRFVQKVECANHVTRALSDNLHKLVDNTQYSLPSRQLLSKPASGETISRLERIVKGVRTAIKEAGASETTNVVSVLRHDIHNAPDHVFGNHKNCTSFCKRKMTEQEDVTSQLNPDFLIKIRAIIGNVENKANSLVFNETTNVVEKLMGCIAKFTGGKRINFTTGGSFQRRCYGAGLAHSAGPSWHLSPWKKLNNRSPGYIFKQKFQAREKRRLKRRQLFVESGGPNKRKRRECGKDIEYGPLALEPDIDEEELKNKCDEFIHKLEEEVEFGIDKIQQDTIGQHKNQLWMDKRLNRLTASKFGFVAKRLKHTPCHNLVKSILYPRTLNTESVTFGRDHEDTVVKLYEEKTGNEVKQCGIFIDVNRPFLGASPDGIVNEDGIVEIKCLPSVTEKDLNNVIKNTNKLCLEVTDGGILRLKRSHNYYYQVQGQLNITRKSWCDFVVFTKAGELFIERIEKDVSFWERIVPKLEQFYMECMLPEIVDSRVVRQMKVRDPPYIIQAQEDRKRSKELKH